MKLSNPGYSNDYIKHSRFMFSFYLRLIVSGNKKTHLERDFQFFCNCYLGVGG